MDSIRGDIAAACQAHDLVKLRVLCKNLKALAQEANNSLRATKLKIHVEIPAQREFEVRKAKFCQQAKVGEVIATVFEDWLGPELADSEHDSHGDCFGDWWEGDGDLAVSDWDTIQGRPWYVCMETTLVIEGIPATSTKPTSRLFEFEVDSLEDECTGWHLEQGWPGAGGRLGRRHTHAVTAACGVLLANTSYDLLRSKAVREDVDIYTEDYNGDEHYVHGNVDLRVPVFLVRRLWMSVARLAWNATVVRAAAAC